MPHAKLPQLRKHILWWNHLLSDHIPALALKGLLFFNSQHRRALCLFLPSQCIPTDLPQRILGLILLCPSFLSIFTRIRSQELQAISHPVASCAYTTPSLIDSISHLPVHATTHKSFIARVPCLCNLVWTFPSSSYYELGFSNYIAS